MCKSKTYMMDLAFFNLLILVVGTIVGLIALFNATERQPYLACVAFTLAGRSLIETIIHLRNAALEEN